MTTRINAHHTICPGCQEKVFLDELVGGHCPLCGCVMDEEEEDEFEEVIDRFDLAWLVFHYHVFRKLEEMGVGPYQIMQLLARFEQVSDCEFIPAERLEFTLEATLAGWERLIPRRCGSCGGIFIRGGKKLITVDLVKNDYRVVFRCPRCDKEN